MERRGDFVARIMYDSITATDIPTDAEMVAGYLAPSRFAWSNADWGRFPHAVKVQIAVRSNVNAGHVLDVETGDATPVQAVAWVQMRRKAGADPTVYCSLSQYPAVVAAFVAARVEPPHYWVAHYDGVSQLPAGMVAKQYANPSTSGGHFDLSVVADHWPGVDPSPVPAPQEVDVELTDAIPDNPAPKTVGRALRDLMIGHAGINSAGALAQDIATASSGIQSAVATLAKIQTQLAIITTALSSLAPSVLTGTANVTVALNPLQETPHE